MLKAMLRWLVCFSGGYHQEPFEILSNFEVGVEAAIEAAMAAIETFS